MPYGSWITIRRQDRRRRVPKRGNYDYEYALHSHDMRGTVIVS